MSKKSPDPGGGSRTCREDRGIQVDIKRSRRCCTCVSYSLWTSAVVIAMLATLPVWNNVRGLIDYMLFPHDFKVSSEMMEDLGMEGIVIFKQHDRDGDGVLSLEEFEPIAHRLLLLNETYNYEEQINEWDDVVTIQSDFVPLKLSSMSKSKDGSLYETRPLDSLHGLKFWKKPAKEWKNFAVSHLKHFLPSDPYMLEEVGEFYHLIKPVIDSHGSPLSSNRYLPPPLLGKAEKMIHCILSLFHPRVFVFSRFGPQGSVAVVRAVNERYVEIMFRIHAEFQLNEPPFYPFWFTPAQFTGKIILSKDGTKLLAFNLHVPNHRLLNVDMEWLNAPKDHANMEVDIGYMERMELHATRSSIYVLSDGKNYTEQYIPPIDEADDIIWNKEISEAQAARKLEVAMYPFKKVTYYNITEVYDQAKTMNKPVHSILLWGALDDQSC